MTIETKLTIDEWCWVLHDNKVQKMQVTEIRITVRGGMKNETRYCLHNSSDIYTEESLFESKEALLQSL